MSHSVRTHTSGLCGYWKKSVWLVVFLIVAVAAGGCRRKKSDAEDSSAAANPSAVQPSPAEQKRIDALLDAVGSAEQIVFIRNEQEYPSWAAREWIERKYKKYGAGVQTVEEFIEKMATRSMKTGKPYLIRFSDGRSTESAYWLRSLLSEIEKKDHPTR